MYLKGSFAAQAMTVLFATLALFVQPLFVLMGAGIALVTMSVGLPKGLIISFTALIINVTANWAISRDWQGGLWFSLVLLAPLLVSSYYLSVRLDLAKAVVVIAGFALFVAMLLMVFIPDDGFWFDYLKNITIIAKLPVEDALLHTLAPLMNRTLCFLLFFSVMLSLLLGRYWQSQAYKPGAFGEEFRQYRLSPWITIVCVVLIALAWWGLPPFKDVAWVLIGLLAMQGLAVLHSFAVIKKWPSFGLVAVYCALLLLPSLLLGMAVFGLSDVWLNFRNRLFLSS